jgi:hypothetical protein
VAGVGGGAEVAFGLPDAACFGEQDAEVVGRLDVALRGGMEVPGLGLAGPAGVVQDEREVEGRVGVAGLGGAPVVGHRLLDPALPAAQQPEVEGRARVAGVGRPSEVPFGLLHGVRPDEDGPGVQRPAHVAAVGGAPVRLQGFLRTALLLQQEAEVEAGVAVPGLGRLAVAGLGLGEPAFAGGPQPALEHRLRPVLVRRCRRGGVGEECEGLRRSLVAAVGRLPQEFDRLRRTALPVEQDTEVVGGVEVTAVRRLAVGGLRLLQPSVPLQVGAEVVGGDDVARLGRPAVEVFGLPVLDDVREPERRLRVARLGGLPQRGDGLPFPSGLEQQEAEVGGALGQSALGRDAEILLGLRVPLGGGQDHARGARRLDVSGVRRPLEMVEPLGCVHWAILPNRPPCGEAVWVSYPVI